MHLARGEKCTAAIWAVQSAGSRPRPRERLVIRSLPDPPHRAPEVQVLLPALQPPGTNFSLSFSKEWDGVTVRNFLIAIEDLRNRTWGPGRLRRKRRLDPAKFVHSLRTPLALTFPDTSLFIKVVKSLERKIDEKLRSSTSRKAVNR